MPRLCITTALPAETRPLLDALKLRQIQAPHLRLYGSEQYLLLETGMGKLNAASTTAALLSTFTNISAVLNIGIAGGCFDYGAMVVASRIRDQGTGAQWFPHLPAHTAFRAATSACVDTLDAPGGHYQSGLVFDMEAAGIFSAASRYLSSSQVHSIKLISDNPERSIQMITKASVIELVQQSLPAILPMLKSLSEQSDAHLDDIAKAVDTAVQNAMNTAHHSLNDEQQLRQLLLQYRALTGKLPTMIALSDNAAGIRRELQATIKSQPFVYGES